MLKIDQKKNIVMATWTRESEMQTVKIMGNVWPAMKVNVLFTITTLTTTVFVLRCCKKYPLWKIFLVMLYTLLQFYFY